MKQSWISKSKPKYEANMDKQVKKEGPEKNLLWCHFSHLASHRTSPGLEPDPQPVETNV
jgi:hypothetical protein